ncbi:MAG: fold metallo-hydrolase [Bacilli bacterium]|nr:fold metallo-hydrolase [Bacilli bacterium]
MEHPGTDEVENQFIPVTSVKHGIGEEVTGDVYNVTIQIVNICLVGFPEKPYDWVLIDTGMPKSTNQIIDEVEERFGKDSKPKAILLTHGHFDHVGAVEDLVQKWQVPVYAHELELPFLTGKSEYPPPDPTVEGGLVAKMSALFPNEPVNLGNHVQALPADGTVPEMPGWRWIFTPGHSPGHVSFFRDNDRCLIAGDAFVTVKQESLYSVVTQQQEINGPPRYFTTDWRAAWDSVKKLESLKPAIAVTGHGMPMAGEKLRTSLDKLVREFDSIAIPDYGRYVDH